MVANREPYIHEHTADGGIVVRHPASGLVTALEPVMRACSGVWIGHGSGSADRETADAQGRVAVPPGEGSYRLRRIWLTPEQEKGYYYGFANEGMWPLCHIADARPTFRSEDWQHYQVERRPDPRGGPRQRLGLTPRGRTLDGPAEDSVEGALEREFLMLPREQREAAAEVLEAVAARLADHGSRPRR
ncbi:MAG TPA: trehalose-6-phosphate synthase [Polyangia bacterium]|jgi:hypothetical protein